MVPAGRRLLALEGSQLQADGSIAAVAVRREGGRVVEEEVAVPDVLLLSEEFVAVDLEFLRKCENFLLDHRVTVFARATPELKAVILKKERQRLIEQYRSRSWKSRFFGGRVRKVAMVGDGANDLMAIR